MSIKPFVHVSNSYRKPLWSLSQTIFVLRVPWLIALWEVCSPPCSGLGDSTADTLAKHICIPLAFTQGNLSSAGIVLLQLGLVPGCGRTKERSERSCCLQHFNLLKTKIQSTEMVFPFFFLCRMCYA